MAEMKSSYSQNNYGDLIEAIVRVHQPKRIVEFGILEGYSLSKIRKSAPENASITAYDIFDDFPGNHARYNDLIQKFPENIIQYGDFYKEYHSIPLGSVDLFHIDIANDGNVFDWFFRVYKSRMRQGGIALLEGGSEERDNYSWMVKYNKRKIRNTISYWKEDLHNEGYEITVFKAFPSMTMIYKTDIPEF